MAVSKEVADTVAKIRAQQDYIKADKAADKLRDEKLAEAVAARQAAEAKMADLQAKLDAIPVRQELSQEDKDALQHAFDEASDAQSTAGEALDQVKETHDELKDAVPANADPVAPPASSDAPPKVEPEPIPDDPGAARPDPLPGTARGSDVPLMPNMAFDPDPTGARGPADAGQPNQAKAIETPGGFVVTGGGTTQRAPGSMPDSPSSSQVVPMDPDAKAPANNADLVKSGLGDSSQNATLGADGQPIGSGPGIVKEPTDAEREAAQKQQDALNEEKARREANPLNLAEPGTPQAGSPDADKAARDAALEAQRKAQEDAKAQQAASKPPSDFPDEKAPANPS